MNENVFDFGQCLIKNGFSENPNMPSTFNRISKHINLNHYGVRLLYCKITNEWSYNGSTIKPTEDNAYRFIKMAKLAEEIFDEK